MVQTKVRSLALSQRGRAGGGVSVHQTDDCLLHVRRIRGKDVVIDKSIKRLGHEPRFSLTQIFRLYSIFSSFFITLSQMLETLLILNCLMYRFIKDDVK